MTSRHLFIALAGALAVATPAAMAHEGHDPEQEAADLARAARDFRSRCAPCHGAGGKGDGPVASSLRVRPANLTLLAKRNKGVFPRARVHDAIDGREIVAAHGSREMPVWGLSFQDLERTDPQESMVRERIDLLVHYIESLQRPSPSGATK